MAGGGDIVLFSVKRACNWCVTFIESSQHWFHQAMMMGDLFSSAFQAFGNGGIGWILW